MARPTCIGETKGKPDTRLKEHQDACQSGVLEKSAVAEHAWKDHHSIRWEEVTVVDRTRPEKLPLKEAIHKFIVALYGCYNLVERRLTIVL